jgi:hypothetical protein
MTYWLDLFTPYTWARFRDHGEKISGFRPRQRKTAFERVESGDIFLCYLVKLSRWCGVLEVKSGAFKDASPIFADDNDPFVLRFHVVPKVALDFEYAIPIEELWTELSFTKNIAPGAFGWGQAAGLRQSLVPINDLDARVILSALEKQQQLAKRYELDAVDKRHIAHRTVVRTEKGEVAVEVPERDEEVAEETQTRGEIRSSLWIQSKIAQLGAILGFSIWIPPTDRGRILEISPSVENKLARSLPLNYDLTTLRTIENIDVLWLERRAIAHAFEVEHTTSIYSGLLRMADLLAMQPRMRISLHIVAPADRRDQVRREIIRPVFSVLEGGAMAERCSFLSYDAVDDILSQPNLAHMRESIIGDFEEYFEAT